MCLPTKLLMFSEVTKILTYLAQASHGLVPSEVSTLGVVSTMCVDLTL